MNPAYEAVRAMLIGAAEIQMSPYPQYKGVFQSYVLAKVNRNVKTKMGVAFSKDELVICDPTPNYSGTQCRNYITAWSWKNKVNTSIPASSIEVVV